MREGPEGCGPQREGGRATPTDKSSNAKRCVLSPCAFAAGEATPKALHTVSVAEAMHPPMRSDLCAMAARRGGSPVMWYGGCLARRGGITDMGARHGVVAAWHSVVAASQLIGEHADEISLPI